MIFCIFSGSDLFALLGVGLLSMKLHIIEQPTALRKLFEGRKRPGWNAEVMYEYHEKKASIAEDPDYFWANFLNSAGVNLQKLLNAF